MLIAADSHHFQWLLLIEFVRSLHARSQPET